MGFKSPRIGIPIICEIVGSGKQIILSGEEFVPAGWNPNHTKSIVTKRKYVSSY